MSKYRNWAWIVSSLLTIVLKPGFFWCYISVCHGTSRWLGKLTSRTTWPIRYRKGSHSSRKFIWPIWPVVVNEEGISSLFVVGRQAPRISAEEESMSVPYHNQTAHYSHAFQLSYPNLTISLTRAFAPFNTFFASSGSSSSRERCNLSNLRPLMSRVATGTSSAGHSTIGLVLGKSKTKLEIVNNNSS